MSSGKSRIITETGMEFCPTCGSYLMQRFGKCPVCGERLASAPAPAIEERVTSKWDWVPIEEREAEFREAVADLLIRKMNNDPALIDFPSDLSLEEAIKRDVFAPLIGDSRTFCAAEFARLKNLIFAKTATTADAPTEEEYCEKCKAKRTCWIRMAQTRSADEGQTVFYTCTECSMTWSKST